MAMVGQLDCLGPLASGIERAVRARLIDSIPQNPSDCGVKGKYISTDGNPSPVIRFVASVDC